MSTWTHLCGCIRIDGIPFLERDILDKVKTIMGNACDFDDSTDKWEKCNVPCGSEGSLKYEIIPAGEGLVLYTVPIWGDLRDYDDEQEITDWFNRITMDSGLMIRSAILEYSVEFGNTKVLQYKRKST